MIETGEPLGRDAMPAQIGENRAKKMLKANELVLCMGVNQLRTPNIAMIAAACGFDAVYIDLEHNPTSLETAAGVCVAALGMGSRRSPELPRTTHTMRPASSTVALKGSWCRMSRTREKPGESSKPVSMHRKATARPLAAVHS
jgi:hypothetical protein